MTARRVPMDDNNKNLILATVLSMLVLLVWFVLFPPEEPGLPLPDPAVDAGSETGGIDGGIATAPPVVPGADGAPAPAAEAAADAPRIAVETPELTGSINLSGGRLDDLKLTDYRETLDEDSDLVRLLSPVGGLGSYYALFGWSPSASLGADAVPGASTLWSVESGETLTPRPPSRSDGRARPA